MVAGENWWSLVNAAEKYESSLIPEFAKYERRVLGERRSSAAPLLPQEKQKPKKQDTSDLIRNHNKVLIAVCYEFIQFMLSCCVLSCSLYIRSDTITSSSEHIKLLSHKELKAYDVHRADMKTNTSEFAIVLIVGGIFMVMINAFLIHQCFAYGINIISNLVGVIAVFIIAVILGVESFLVYYDVSRYPNDRAGFIEYQIHLFIHIVKIALEEDDLLLKSILDTFHRKLECCGIYSISDFYTAREINVSPEIFVDDVEFEQVAQALGAENNTFRISNSWVHNCSQEATRLLGTRAICYAPAFCCLSDHDSIVPYACPPVEWDGVSEPEIPHEMHRHSCVKRIALGYRNKTLNLTLLNVIIALVSIFYGIHLVIWYIRCKPLRKSLQSTTSSTKNENVAEL